MLTDEYGFRMIRDLSTEGIAAMLSYRVAQRMVPFDGKYITSDDVVSLLAEVGVDVTVNIASRALDITEGVTRYVAKVNIGKGMQPIYGIGDGHDPAQHLRAASEYKNGDAWGVDVLAAAIEAGEDIFRSDVVTSTEVAEWAKRVKGVDISSHIASKRLSDMRMARLGNLQPYGGGRGTAYAIRNEFNWVGKPLGEIVKYRKGMGL